MYTFIFGLIAFILAIPTWGMSLVIFFWLKKKYDDMAVVAILNKAKLSAMRGSFEELYKINNAAIDKVYTLFGTQVFGYPLEEYYRANKAGILRTDYHFDNDIIYPLILHPEIGKIHLWLQQGEGNKLNIFAIRAE